MKAGSARKKYVAFVARPPRYGRQPKVSFVIATLGTSPDQHRELLNAGQTWIYCEGLDFLNRVKISRLSKRG